MKKIIAFGASSSKNSINKKFAVYVAHLFKQSNVEVLDLNNYEMPIFSVDKEKTIGIPSEAHLFYNTLSTADLLVISFTEHNGNFTAAFKNILDWASRINAKTFQDKPVLLLATSPGARGASTVLDIATKRFPFQGGVIKGSFSLPNFNDNFNEYDGITNIDLKNKLLEILNSIEF